MHPASDSSRVSMEEKRETFFRQWLGSGAGNRLSTADYRGRKGGLAGAPGIVVRVFGSKKVIASSGSYQLAQDIGKDASILEIGNLDLRVQPADCRKGHFRPVRFNYPDGDVLAGLQICQIFNMKCL